MAEKLIWLVSTVVALAGCGDGPFENGPADSGQDTETGFDGTFLIDDCDDGDNVNELGGLWVSYDDYHDPGEGESEVWPTSWFKDGTFEMSDPGYGDSGYAARMIGTTSTKLGYDYVGMIAAFGPSSFCPDPQPAPFDVAEYTGLRFMAKGTATGGNLTVKIIHTKDGEEDNCTDNGLTGDTLTNWVDYSADITGKLKEAWTEIAVDFRRDFSGAGSVDIETVLEHAKSVHFMFQTSNGGEVDLAVDNLAFYTDESPEIDKEPDMVVRLPDPPEDEELASLEIDHPLQAVALDSLDKGYNITNWLEQRDFVSFDTYNEEFIANLVSAGFEALRLPIDLDRYISNRADYFGGEETLEIDPQLFTILDAFDEWTLAAGISLTIDYHQYDQSFDIGDPLVTDAAIYLWGAIAEHFADNTRPDLFFELLNEIEQAGGTNEVDQDEWRDLAMRIIDEIRLYDAERPILFGDVAWYSIDRLADRAPLGDDNIIYVFHFYDPFIFTHQGASWTDVSTAHDIPYPYSAERWPEYYSDIGIDPAVQPSWIMDQVNSYYRNGNRSAMRNRIIKAKRWAQENNVPVICNELGAFDASSLKEDRVAYYADLVGIFEELEIPWQHWFMIMDAADGAVDPDLAAAFGLK
jgi:licheninase